MDTIYYQIVPFHGCRYLVPELRTKGERAQWEFTCVLPIGEPCHKTIKKREPSTGCLTDEYEVRYHGEMS